jgi:hypothetical protein
MYRGIRLLFMGTNVRSHFFCGLPARTLAVFLRILCWEKSWENMTEIMVETRGKEEWLFSCFFAVLHGYIFLLATKSLSLQLKRECDGRLEA